MLQLVHKVMNYAGYALTMNTHMYRNTGKKFKKFI